MSYFPLEIFLFNFFYTGDFRQFDYGTVVNQQKYKSMIPSRYDLSKVTAPVQIYYGDGDYLVSGEVRPNVYKFIVAYIFTRKIFRIHLRYNGIFRIALVQSGYLFTILIILIFYGATIQNLYCTTKLLQQWINIKELNSTINFICVFCVNISIMYFYVW